MLSVSSDNLVAKDNLVLDFAEVPLQLIVGHLLEEVVAQRWLLVETLDLVADHLFVHGALLHERVEQLVRILVQLHELLNHVVSDALQLLVLRRVVTLAGKHEGALKLAATSNNRATLFLRALTGAHA